LGIFSCHHLQIQQVKHNLTSAYFVPFIFLPVYYLELTFHLFFIFTTVRLWSTKLNANLVCYKGHNYPVWDVQVCEQTFSLYHCCGNNIWDVLSSWDFLTA
jgi:hypothetical protein